MIEEITLSPFQRRLTGPKNEFVIREHDSLPRHAARAIMRRRQPAWSQFRCGFQIAEGTSHD